MIGSLKDYDVGHCLGTFNVDDILKTDSFPVIRYKAGEGHIQLDPLLPSDRY
jgi:hypothetical protein